MGTKMKKELDVLKRKIDGKYHKARLLGDIPISEQEYELLLEYFKDKGKKYILDQFPEVDQLYSIILVQIGIRYYDGGFWPHVSQILGLRSLSPQQQHNLAVPFITTLKKYGKEIVNEHEYVNTILMHGFVSTHYVKNLLDFLYRFYSIDIQRDLKSDVFKPALDFLIDVIQKQEEDDHSQSNRSYILRKQTIDGIKHSSKRSIAMRFRWLLRTIDKYWFGEVVNRNSSSRLIREVANWFDTSPLKKDASKATSSERKRGEQRSSAPFIRYNYKTNTFTLIIPGQSFIARNNESLTLTVTINGNEYHPKFELSEVSTLLRTTEVVMPIFNGDIYGEIKVAFITNREERSFIVTCGDPIVFFDSRYYSTHVYNKKQIIQAGVMYAFMLGKTDLKVFGAYESETLGDVKRLSLNLGVYDYIVLNGKKLYTIKASVENGLSSRGLVDLATSSGLQIYKDKPLLFIRTTETKMNGGAVVLHSKKYRLTDLDPTIAERFPDGSLQAILNLQNLIDHAGEYRIMVDIPGYEVRKYQFVYLPEFDYSFENSPFIFVNQGFISFTKKEVKGNYERELGVYKFEIDETLEDLNFNLTVDSQDYPITIQAPIFKWSRNNAEYTTAAPDPLWHGAFPYAFDVLFNEPFRIVIEGYHEDEWNIEPSQIGQGKYHCDLTKFKTWFMDSETSPVQVVIEYRGKTYPFAEVYTKTEITSMSALSYDEERHCITGYFERFGMDALYLSVIHVQTGTELCTHLPLNEDSFSIDAKDLAGDYSIEFFVKRKGFGNTYTSIYKALNRLVTNNLEGLCFSIVGHYGKERYQVERYTFPHRIVNVQKVDKDIYVGNLKKVVRTVINSEYQLVTLDVCEVKIWILGVDKVGWQANLMIVSDYEGEEDNQSFLYDRAQKELVVDENPNLTPKQRYVKYADLTDRTFDLMLYKPEVV